jgi:hypothetical protein
VDEDRIVAVQQHRLILGLDRAGNGAGVLQLEGGYGMAGDTLPVEAARTLDRHGQFG